MEAAELVGTLSQLHTSSSDKTATSKNNNNKGLIGKKKEHSFSGISLTRHTKRERKQPVVFIQTAQLHCFCERK